MSATIASSLQSITLATGSDSSQEKTGQLYKVEMRSGGVIAYRLPLWQKMLIGAMSGGLGASAVFPIDLIKTRLQTATGMGLTARGVVTDVIKTSGYRGLYSGLLPNVLGAMPEKAIKLGVNEQFRDWLTPDRRDETLSSQMVSGALTALVQTTVANPYEVVKLNLQLLEKSNAAAKAAGLPLPTAQSASAIARELGMRGLYRGYGAILIRDVPYNMIFFSIYIQSKHFFTDSEGTVSNMAVVGCGVAAGSIASWTMTPADVIKTRLQRVGSPFKSIQDCALATFKEGGYRAFFKGALMRACTSGPLYGIALLCFELQSRYMNSIHILPNPIKEKGLDPPIIHRKKREMNKKEMNTNKKKRKDLQTAIRQRNKIR